MLSIRSNSLQCTLVSPARIKLLIIILNNKKQRLSMNKCEMIRNTSGVDSFPSPLLALSIS